MSITDDMLRLKRVGSESSKPTLKLKQATMNIIALIQQDLPIDLTINLEDNYYIDRDSFTFLNHKKIEYNRENCLKFSKYITEGLLEKVYCYLEDSDIVHKGLEDLLIK